MANPIGWKGSQFAATKSLANETAQFNQSLSKIAKPADTYFTKELQLGQQAFKTERANNTSKMLEDHYNGITTGGDYGGNYDPRVLLDGKSSIDKNRADLLTSSDRHDSHVESLDYSTKVNEYNVEVMDNTDAAKLGQLKTETAQAGLDSTKATTAGKILNNEVASATKRSRVNAIITGNAEQTATSQSRVAATISDNGFTTFKNDSDKKIINAKYGETLNASELDAFIDKSVNSTKVVRKYDTYEESLKQAVSDNQSMKSTIDTTYKDSLKEANDNFNDYKEYHRTKVKDIVAGTITDIDGMTLEEASNSYYQAEAEHNENIKSINAGNIKALKNYSTIVHKVAKSYTKVALTSDEEKLDGLYQKLNSKSLSPSDKRLTIKAISKLDKKVVASKSAQLSVITKTTKALKDLEKTDSQIRLNNSKSNKDSGSNTNRLKVKSHNSKVLTKSVSTVFGINTSDPLHQKVKEYLSFQMDGVIKGAITSKKLEDYLESQPNSSIESIIKKAKNFKG